MLNIRQIVKQRYTLTEGFNMDKTWEKLGHKVTQKLFDEDVFDNHKEHFRNHVEAADPTEHKEYATWIASKYANSGTFPEEHPMAGQPKGINKLEDFGRTRNALAAYHKGKIKKQLATHGIPTDINQIPSLNHLEDHVDKLPTEEKKISDVMKTGDADIHKDEHWTTVIPHNQTGADAFSQGSRWCTRTDYGHSYFNSYHSKGPLHIMIPHNPEHPGEKYQFHLESGSFMDEKDAPASLNILGKRPNHAVSNHIENNLAKAPSHMKVGLIASGNDEQRERMMGDQDYNVQQALEMHGNTSQKARSGKWMDDNFDKAPLEIRKHAARFGPEYRQDKLVNDKELAVQEILAQHGTEKHKDALLENPNLNQKIIHGLVKSGDKKYLDKFSTHSEPVVRGLVARHGSIEHRKALKNDPSFIVKSEVLQIAKKNNEQL